MSTVASCEPSGNGRPVPRRNVSEVACNDGTPAAADGDATLRREHGHPGATGSGCDILPPVNSLLAHHRRELQGSGLTDETIAAAGIYSVTAASDLARLLNRQRISSTLVPAIVFPFTSLGENSLEYARAKPDHPRLANGKTVKYESPCGRPNEVYVPLRTLNVLADSTVPLLITEGEKKALAADQFGFPCLGLVGVYGWKFGGREELLPALARVAWAGREVAIAFDSDLASNREVQNAAARLATQLHQRGANVKIVRLPAGSPDRDGTPTKVGLDDYLVAHSADAFQGLLESAVDHREMSIGETRLRARDADPANESSDYLERLRQDGLSRLRIWRGGWMVWRAGRYVYESTADVQAGLVNHLNSRLIMLGTREVGNILLQIRAQASLPANIDSPSWIGEAPNAWPPNEVLACRNELIHIPSLVTNRPYSRPATPQFFTMSALEFDFDIAARRPVGWLNFLDQIWSGQTDCIDALQQWFGYCLTPDTSQQKIMFMIGPKRSGKGTIARILRQLVGEQNVAGPTLSSLTQNFGLAPLLGKSLAVIADARLSGRSDSSIIVERLLSISGEDTMTADRKYQESVTTKLPTRLMLLSNELPRLTDASNALASRMIILPLRESFLGREDPRLTDRLLSELPGILLWAVEGWRRLQARGRFIEPTIATQLRDDLERLCSPVAAYVHERCRIAADAHVSTSEIHRDYQRWCADAGQHPAAQNTFARDLRAVVSQIDVLQPRVDGRRERRYVGIGLLPRE